MSEWPREEIVEDRVWRHGVEIVSHVNLTRIASVRRSLGIVGEYGGSVLDRGSRAEVRIAPRSLRMPRGLRPHAA